MDKITFRGTLAVLVFLSILYYLPAIAADLSLDLIFIAEGDSYTDRLGYRVGSPGDLDGDGFSEVFAGCTEYVKVFKGDTDPDTLPDKIYPGSFRIWILDDLNDDGQKDIAIDVRDLSTEYVNLYLSGPDFYSKDEPDLSFKGDYWEGFGGQVYSADTDNDDENELIISMANGYGEIDGKFQIFEISESMDTIPDDSLVIVWNGAQQYTMGACVGDLNNDGYGDFVVTPYVDVNPSFILIYLGAAHIDSIPDYKTYTPFEETGFGWSIVPIGDVNKDNYADFVVTSSSNSPCIFYGGNPFDTVPKILQYPGEIANTCGDINHDGWTDIAVSWSGYDFGSGIVYIYFGAYDMDTIADIIIPYTQAPHVSYNFGKALGSAGDFNGDGVDDLAVGASISINPNFNEGYLFIFAGDPDLPTAADDEPDIPIPENHDILNQNYPNPFNNQTIIEYYLQGISDREIELSIYNILGQKIRTLYQGIQSGGNHIAYWDGKDYDDQTVCTGLYFYQLKSNLEVISRKMLYLK